MSNSCLNLITIVAPLTQLLNQYTSLTDTRPKPPVPLTLDPQLPDAHPLHQLCHHFQLSHRQRDLLLLCLTLELYPHLKFACAILQQDPEQTHITYALAQMLLSSFEADLLTAQDPLNYWQLIQVERNHLSMESILTLDPPILTYLLGETSLDPDLEGIVYPLRLDPSLIFPNSYQAILSELSHHLTQPAFDPPLIHLQGSDQASRQQLVAQVAAQLSTPLQQLHPEDLPTEPRLRDRLRRRWERHALLSGAILLIELEQNSAEIDPSQRLQHQRLIRWISQCRTPIILSGSERLRLEDRPTQAIELPGVTIADRETLWSRCLGERAESLNGTIPQIAEQFLLQPQQIAHLATQLSSDHSEDLPTQLWTACRQAARPQLQDLAQRVTTHLTWDDLVFPEKTSQELQSVVAAVRQRAQVYQDWGFAKPEDRGLGIIALFSGYSGTGKTTAAEIIARELALDCYRIDLSNIVNKYIGETEKNLKRVFDAAEGSGAMLLFDEADAVFGMRGEVKEARDRYANQEVSYLLQRLESYPGLVILTSNLKSSIDDAFMRRLRYVIEFPEPSVAERQRIWQRIFPPKVPTDGLHYRRLAELQVTGATIRNIALTAAFLAADTEEPITMELILQAARAEYGKFGRYLSSTESAALRMKRKS
ncbi:MAG: ATP-binding protein [Cyanobacteria bacterium P01_G01_bin.54]